MRAATPPSIADELIYHLPVTAEFVQQGRVSPLYDNSLGNMPFLIHMVYALCLMANSDIAARLFSLFVAVATALALYGFSIRFLSRHTAVISLFSFFAAGMVVEVAVTTRIDVALAGMLFMTTYAMANFLSTERRGWLWVSALLAGFSLGIKHTAALWLIFVGVMYLVETIRKRYTLGRLLKLGVGYTLLALVVASPWYIKNAIWFNNPFYPFATGEVAEFGSTGVRYFNADDERKLDAHFAVARRERPDMVSEHEDELMGAAKSRLSRNPMRLWEFFFKPNTYLMAEPYQFPNYLFLIIPFVVFLKPNRWVVWLLALSLAFVFSVTLTSWIARYLLPAYPALTIVTAYTLTAIASRLESRMPFAKRIPIYASVAALATVLATSASSMRQFHTLQFLAGTISRHGYLTNMPHHRPLELINTQLPPDARVMMIGAQMNYGLKRQYFADESWFATKWRRLLAHNDSLEGAHQALKAQGFTHIS